MSNTPPPIDCALHDLVEVACLYRLDVELTLVDGRVVRGRARTTITLPDKTEVWRIGTRDGDVDAPLHEVARMRALQPNPHFDTVRFLPDDARQRDGS